MRVFGPRVAAARQHMEAHLPARARQEQRGLARRHLLQHRHHAAVRVRALHHLGHTAAYPAPPVCARIQMWKVSPFGSNQ